jgi:hypothetical protein
LVFPLNTPLTITITYTIKHTIKYSIKLESVRPGRMDKVLWIRHEDRLACVEAGITGSALEAVLASALVVFFFGGGKRCEILTKKLYVDI